MCVIVGMKLPRNKKTGLPEKNATWRLAKIRDRSYVPDYKIMRHTVKETGFSQLFVIDQNTDWTEGVSVNPKDESAIFMVNSALNNYADKKDDGSKTKTNGSITDNGESIRKILKTDNLEEAIDLIKELKLDGNTLITDGNTLYHVEIYLSKESKEKYKDKGNKRYRDIATPDDYTFNIQKIENDFIVVKTNHGEIDEDAGYTEIDGDSYESSIKRNEHTLRELTNRVYEPIELIRVLSSLRTDKIDKNPFFRPIRLKDEINSNIFSTSIIQIDKSGTIILKPIECTIKNYNIMNLISKKYLTNLVILPEVSPLYETFKDYISINELNRIIK